MTATPDLRIGDADREAGAAALREHYAQGRLSLEEFNERLDAIFAATTQRQLDGVTRDLPHVRPAAVRPATSPAPAPGQPGGPWPGTQWQGSQWQGSQWQGNHGHGHQDPHGSGGHGHHGHHGHQGPHGPGGHGPRRGTAARLAMSSLTLVVLLAAVFFLFLAPSVLHFGGFPIPGRFSILIAGLLILRSIFRRIFGLARGRGRGRWAAGHYQPHGHAHHGHWGGPGHGGHW